MSNSVKNTSESRIPAFERIMKFLVWAGCVLLIVAPMLPYMSANIYGKYHSTNLFDAGGRQGEAILYFIFSGSISVAIYFKRYLLSLSLSVLPICLWILHIVQHFTQVLSSSISNGFRFEIGCYLIFLGATVTFISTLVLCLKNRQH